MEAHIAVLIPFFALVILCFCIQFSSKIIDFIILLFDKKSSSNGVTNEQISSDDLRTINIVTNVTNSNSEIDNHERRRRYEENLRIRALASDNSETPNFTQTGLRVTLPPPSLCSP